MGSGRSLYAASIPLSQLSITTGKIVFSSDDLGFPESLVKEFMKNLEEKFGNVCVIVNSGSGESIDPKITLNEIANYIEENKSNKIKINVVTSNLYSTIGKIGQKYGNIIELKGREKLPQWDYKSQGIMGDVYELGSAYILQAIINAVYFKDENKIFDYIDNELPFIGSKIDEYICLLEDIVNILEKRCNVFGSARGTGEKVVDMTLIRLHHVKSVLGDGVYKARGINTPRPRKGDLQISVSFSGETKVVIEWVRTFKELEGYQFSISSNPNSKIIKLSDFKIILREKEDSMPRKFYIRAAFVLSPIPLLLIDKLNKKGLNLPEHLIRYLYHSVIE